MKWGWKWKDVPLSLCRGMPSIHMALQHNPHVCANSSHNFSNSEPVIIKDYGAHSKLPKTLVRMEKKCSNNHSVYNNISSRSSSSSNNKHCKNVILIIMRTRAPTWPTWCWHHCRRCTEWHSLEPKLLLQQGCWQGRQVHRWWRPPWPRCWCLPWTWWLADLRRRASLWWCCWLAAFSPRCYWEEDWKPPFPSWRPES